MRYVFAHKKYPERYVELQFVKGKLQEIRLNQRIQAGGQKALEFVFAMLHMDWQQCLERLAEKGFEQVNGKPEAGKTAPAPQPAYKIVLWQKAWRHYRKSDWHMSRHDLAKLNKLELSEAEMEAQLNAYFTCGQWFAKSPSLSGFIAHQNLITDWRTNREKIESKYPEQPCKSDEAKIKDAQEVIRYRKHFKQLGWQRNPVSGEWKPPQTQQR